MSGRIRVVVADDQNISRAFFELYVRSDARYRLLAALRTAQETVDYVDAHETDLVILDIMMRNGIDGLTAAGEIKRKHPEVRIILTTSSLETTWEDQARAIGVEGFWYKEYEVHSLMEMMDRVMTGASVYPSDPPELNLGKVKRSKLTVRELDVLRELTRNLTNEEIAEKLNVSASTVKRHIENMLQKTGFRNRIDLAMNAKALGLVVSEEDRTRGNSAT
ncbi:MAG: response regulator transcription factor [Clostridiales bacterium]|nr:response regulator transcription factor [Clostridiales bacterium]